MRFRLGSPWTKSPVGLAAAAFLWGCAHGAAVGDARLNPLGEYDVTLSSESLVSEGTMSIEGGPGAYRGLLVAGSMTARIVGVEVDVNQMHVTATVESGRLVLRLAGDESFLAGNWVLGTRRGTVTATRLRSPGNGDQSSPGGSAGPVSTGTSSRPPHSDQDPS